MSFFSRCTHWSSRKSRSKTKLQRSYPVPTRELSTKNRPQRSSSASLKYWRAAFSCFQIVYKVSRPETQFWLSCSDFRLPAPG